ncbi:MAG: hypothetical protein Q8R08_01695 [bacterium]|nr:hypothetical protein [bacterium]
MAIGVFPEKLEFDLKKGEDSSQKIFIHNLEANPTKIALNLADQKYAKQIIISPQELILPGLQAQEVEIETLSAKALKTEIEIMTLATTQGQLQIASGIKIPLEVKTPNAFGWLTVALPIFLALLVTAASYYLKGKQLKMA